MLSIMATGSTSTSINTGELASQLRLGVMRLARRLRTLSPDELELLTRAAALLERLTEDPTP